jgi:hypothetical protein
MVTKGKRLGQIASPITSESDRRNHSLRSAEARALLEPARDKARGRCDRYRKVDKKFARRFW